MNLELLNLINKKNSLVKKIKDGNANSGNFNHGGRPGKVGGSSTTTQGNMVKNVIPQIVNNLVPMEQIYAALKNSGIQNPVDHFGIVPKKLSLRLQKRLDQGEENWNSIFKNKEEYEKAVELKKELETQNLTDTPQYQKVFRALNRYDFINSLAREIEADRASSMNKEEVINKIENKIPVKQ